MAEKSPRERWRQGFGAASQRDDEFTTMSGLPLEPVYGSDDGEFPGQWPYTRGPYASMYRSKLWTMRMFAGFGTAPDTNPTRPSARVTTVVDTPRSNVLESVRLSPSGDSVASRGCG